MELTWLMRLRIAAAAAVGVVLIGVLAWPLAAPPDPAGAVRSVDISFSNTVILLVVAFLAGYIAYFASWPYGREIGILAVPFGLTVWAGRSGSMAGLIALNPTVTQRQELFAALKWEPVFWLVVVAAGFVGVLAAQKTRSKSEPNETPEKAEANPSRYLNQIIALAGSVLIAHFCIGLLAQDVKIFDNKLGFVVGQPVIGQIVFAVLVSFGLAAFLSKAILNASYIWSAAASGLVTALGITIYGKQNLLEHLAKSWPAAFFSNTVISVLPVQMVAFGTLGAVAGYWLAVRYKYWRKSAPQ
jgi:hypothetical protein